MNNYPNNPKQNNFKNQLSKNDQSRNNTINKPVENTEEVSSGRTRRRRSAVTS